MSGPCGFLEEPWYDLCRRTYPNLDAAREACKDVTLLQQTITAVLYRKLLTGYEIVTPLQILVVSVVEVVRRGNDDMRVMPRFYVEVESEATIRKTGGAQNG